MADKTRIDDYGIVGDGRSAALISREGSVDWLCWPNFDSPSLFAALLDAKRGGRWKLAPASGFKSRRRYIPDSNVLETKFETSEGTLSVVDFMPAENEEEKRGHLFPEHELVRIATCERGEVELESVCAPAPEYASHEAKFVESALGLRAEVSRGAIFLRGEIPVHAEGDRAVGRARLRAGESAAFSLSYSNEGPAVLPCLGAGARKRRDKTVEWWRTFASRIQYDGPHKDEVIRSLLVLKLMVYAPSGAMVAAPTTSLPERIGKSLNWDYRFCWLRDAALTVRALLDLGYREDAEAFVSWLLHTTRITRPEVHPFYTLYGETSGSEKNVPTLRGYAASRPVRIGNAAATQIQLDVYGEVVDAATRLFETYSTLDKETQKLVVDLGKYVVENWRLEDAGIWESRGAPLRHTFSIALCCVALERLKELDSKGLISGIPMEKFDFAAVEMRRTIEERGWNESLGSYAGLLDSDQLDASLLLLPWYGFLPPDSQRGKRTIFRIIDSLCAGKEALLYRNENDRQAQEGAFLSCSFWAAEALWLVGEKEKAEEWFEDALKYSNDLGLFAEEFDKDTGQALGNFPQALTHIALINTALSHNSFAPAAAAGRKR